MSVGFGEGVAVLVSGCWAVCSLAFAVAGRRVDSTTVNLVRIVIAFGVLASVHMAQFGSIWPAAASERQIVLLLASGLVGLAIGDQCLFYCLAQLGPRIGSLLMALAPAMTAILGWTFLGEALGAVAIVGIALTTVGVVAVVTDRSGRESWRPPGEGALSARLRSLAVLGGVLGALGQAVGLVLGKMAIRGSGAGDLGGVDAIEPFSGTVVRMSAGACGVLLFALLSRRGFAVRGLLRDRRAGLAMVVGTISGPILGVWLSLVAVKHADVGVAATLMALTPVLMIPISRLAYRARPGPRAIIGTVVAVCGAAMLF